MSTVRVITEHARQVRSRVWDEVVMAVRDMCVLVFGMVLGAVLMAAVVLK
jgi:hypothetical protein